MPERKWLYLLGVVIILLGTIVAYLPAMKGEFVWDDDAHVRHNMVLRDARGLAWIWTKLGATPQYYPLTHTTFWVQYQLFGPGPFSFHLGNVLLHAGNAISLWWILHRLGLKGAFIAALLFAWHPVHVESVAWISERKNTLSGFFYLLAAACAIRAFHLGDEQSARTRPEMRWYLFMLACALAAMLSKTITGTLPAALMVLAWWKRKRINWRLALWLTPLWIAAVVFARITSHLEHTAVGATGPEYDLSLIQRLLIATRAIVFYASKLIAPIDLTFNYPRWNIEQASVWQWLFPIGLTAVVITLWAMRRRIGYGPVAGVFFFMGTLFPALGFVNVYPMRFSFVADHFQYLASIGLLVLIAEGLVRYLRPVVWPTNLGMLLTAIVPLMLLFLTYQQAGIFVNAETLWNDTLVKNPRSWIAYDHLARQWLSAAEQTDDPSMRAQFAAEAEKLYTQSLQIEPDHIEVYLGLSRVRLVQQRRAEAIELVKKAVAIRSKKIAPLNELANLLEKDQPVEAAEIYARVLQIDERFEQARLGLARTLATTGHIDDAIAQCRRAIELFPEGVTSRLLLGDLYFNKGLKREAQQAYEEALRLKPADSKIQDRLRAVQP